MSPRIQQFNSNHCPNVAVAQGAVFKPTDRFWVSTIGDGGRVISRRFFTHQELFTHLWNLRESFGPEVRVYDQKLRCRRPEIERFKYERSGSVTTPSKIREMLER